MRAVWLVVLAGCGFRSNGGGGGRDGATTDVAIGDAEMVDAAGDAPASVTCWSHWLAGSVTFSGATALAAINSSSYDRDPSLAPDGLALFWSSGRATSQNGDIWTSVRLTPTAAFTAAALRPDANSGGDETRLSMSDDGLLVALGSNRTGTEGDVDVFLATRATATDLFGTFDNAQLTAVNDSNAQHDPFLSGDGLRLYFAPTGGGQHLEVASRTARSAAFGAPVSLIDSGAGDADPTLSPDERVIVFSSRQTGSALSDLWFATRASATATFGAAIQLPAPVNSAAEDGDPAISADGCQLYFASTRAGGLGDFDLYVATVTP